jgi:hypothetical protein
LLEPKHTTKERASQENFRERRKGYETTRLSAIFRCSGCYDCNNSGVLYSVQEPQLRNTDYTGFIKIKPENTYALA